MSEKVIHTLRRKLKVVALHDGRHKKEIRFKRRILNQFTVTVYPHFFKQDQDAD